MGRIVLLGGSGFIGSAIAKAFRQASQKPCVALSSSDVDLRNSGCGETLSPLLADAAVIYAAGIPRLKSNDLESLLDNISMIHNLTCQMQTYRPSKVIFLSSVEVYGAPRKLPINEQTEIRPHTLYGIGKRTAELMLQACCDSLDVPLAILRLPGVYGPGDRGRGLIGRLVEYVRDDKTFQLHGDGEAKRDFVLVDDVAQITLDLTESSFQSLTINIATGQSCTVNEIIEQVFSLLGRCPIEKRAQQKNECDLEFDNSGLSRVLPNITMTSLSEGLRQYLHDGA